MMVTRIIIIMMMVIIIMIVMIMPGGRSYGMRTCRGPGHHR